MKNKQYIEVFENIKASESLKNNTYSKIIESKNKNLLPKMVLALSILFCIGFSSSFYYMYNKVTSIISVDINPSLEIYINRFDRVVDVRGFNEDGKKISKELDIINNDYNDALEKISLNNDIKKLINAGEELAIAVAVLDDKNNNLVNDTKAFINCHKNTHFTEVTHHEVKDAHHNNLSCGKYKMYLDLKALDSDVTTTDIKDLSTREIIEMMESYDYNYNNHHDHSGHHSH